MGRLLKPRTKCRKKGIRIVVRNKKSEIRDSTVNDFLLVKELHPAGTHINGEIGEGEKVKRRSR